MQLHQSPTSSSSQTITTIASINRPDDNDNALSMTLQRDVTSLVRINEMTAKCHRNMTKKSQHEDATVNCNNSRIKSSCSNSIESSDSRCTSYCNKDFDHHNYHQINRASKIDNVKGSEEYSIECKNVNISNMTELNKALMSNSHVSTLPRSTQTRASFLDRDRCEMGIR